MFGSICMNDVLFWRFNGFFCIGFLIVVIFLMLCLLFFYWIFVLVLFEFIFVCVEIQWCFVGLQKIVMLNGIDSFEEIEIDGMQQWFLICGLDCKNLVFLMIYGGFGILMMLSCWVFQ